MRDTKRMKEELNFGASFRVEKCSTMQTAYEIVQFMFILFNFIPFAVFCFVNILHIRLYSNNNGLLVFMADFLAHAFIVQFGCV